MAEQKNPVADIFRKKFEMFAKLKAEIGEQKAWEKMFEGYPENALALRVLQEEIRNEVEAEPAVKQ